MRRVYSLVSLIVLAFAQLLTAETINFNFDFPLQSGIVFGQYSGFSFSGFRYGGVFDPADPYDMVIPGTGYFYAASDPVPFLDYPYGVPFSDPGQLAFFSPTGFDLFTLNTLEMNTDYGVPIFGLKRGVVVAQKNYDGSDTFNWSGIDAVAFPTVIGTNTTLNLYGMVVNEPVPGAVPEIPDVFLVSSGIAALCAVGRGKGTLRGVQSRARQKREIMM